MNLNKNNKCNKQSERIYNKKNKPNETTRSKKTMYKAWVWLDLVN